MTASVKAGITYFAIVYAAGFILGTIRVFFVIPRLGEFSSVIIELPIMLAVSWMICGLLLTRFSVPNRWRSRLTMAIIAFALLMIAETILSLLLVGKSIGEHLVAYASPQGALGLAGQLVFAALPIIKLRLRSLR